MRELYTLGLMLAVAALASCALFQQLGTEDEVARAIRIGSSAGTVACTGAVIQDPDNADNIVRAVAAARVVISQGGDRAAVDRALEGVDLQVRTLILAGVDLAVSGLSLSTNLQLEQGSAGMAGVLAALDACERIASPPSPV